jgi:hypothetical protein
MLFVMFDGNQLQTRIHIGYVLPQFGRMRARG